MTQQETARLLGWGEATLGRYENGSLQTEAHDKALRDLMDPHRLARAMAAEVDAVPEEKRRALLGRIRSDEGLLGPDELRAIRQKYGLDEAAMGGLLSTTGESWAAWERGDDLLPKAFNIILRLVARRPSIVRDLLGDAGIESAPAERALREIDDVVSRQVAENMRGRHGGAPGTDTVREVQEEIRKVQPDVAARLLGYAA